MILERIYTIPLRKSFMKAPRYKRTKRAINAIKAFSIRHMKCDNVKIGKYLNLEMWKHGRKKPPCRIQVKMIKDKKKIKDKEIEFVKVDLINAPVEKKEEIKKKGLKEKLAEKSAKKEENKIEEEKKEILEHKTPKKVKPEREFSKDKSAKKEENKIEEEKKEILEHKTPKKVKPEKEFSKDKSAIKSEGFKKSKIIGRTSKK